MQTQTLQNPFIYWYISHFYYFNLFLFYSHFYYKNNIYNNISHHFTLSSPHINVLSFHYLFKILYLIFDYPHKHYTFKYFEV